MNFVTCFLASTFMQKYQFLQRIQHIFQNHQFLQWIIHFVREKTCLVQKRQFLQWVMLSFSKTTVFTTNCALFFQKQQFTKSALPSLAAGPAHEKCAAEPGRRPGPRKVRWFLYPLQKPQFLRWIWLLCYRSISFYNEFCHLLFWLQLLCKSISFYNEFNTFFKIISFYNELYTLFVKKHVLFKNVSFYNELCSLFQKQQFLQWIGLLCYRSISFYN